MLQEWAIVWYGARENDDASARTRKKMLAQLPLPQHLPRAAMIVAGRD
jgi:hypothetical protein